MAALLWLDLICLHFVALFGLTTRGNRSTKHVNAMDFQKIRVSTWPYRDQQFIVEKFLYDIELEEGKGCMSQEDIKIIEDWLKTNPTSFSQSFFGTKSEARGFKGTYHCETILMCLFLFAKEKRKDLVEKTIQPDDPNYEEYMKSHLIPPSKEVIDALPKRLNVLSVSKRCCPSCDALASFIKSGIKPDIVYPGPHATWSGVTLPPWILKHAGNAVLAAMKTKLRQRFATILKLKKTSLP